MVAGLWNVPSSSLQFEDNEISGQVKKVNKIKLSDFSALRNYNKQLDDRT